MRTFVSALKVEPSRENRDAVWAGVSAALGGGSGGGSEGSEGSDGGGSGAAKPSTAPPPATAPVSSGVGAKLVVGATALLGAGALVLYATRSPAPEAPSPVASAVVAAPPVAGSVANEAPAPIASVTSTAPIASITATAREPVSPSSAPTVAARPSAASAPSAPPSAAPAASASAVVLSAADRLREETEGVRRARRSLRDGDPRAALTELDGLDRKFPAGVLEEEREVLRVEALYAAKEPSASRRAERFLLERPQSVHVARIKALLGR